MYFKIFKKIVHTVVLIHSYSYGKGDIFIETWCNNNVEYCTYFLIIYCHLEDWCKLDCKPYLARGLWFGDLCYIQLNYNDKILQLYF